MMKRTVVFLLATVAFLHGQFFAEFSDVQAQGQDRVMRSRQRQEKDDDWKGENPPFAAAEVDWFEALVPTPEDDKLDPFERLARGWFEAAVPTPPIPGRFLPDAGMFAAEEEIFLALDGHVATEKRTWPFANLPSHAPGPEIGAPPDPKIGVPPDPKINPPKPEISIPPDPVIVVLPEPEIGPPAKWEIEQMYLSLRELGLDAEEARALTSLLDLAERLK